MDPDSGGRGRRRHLLCEIDRDIGATAMEYALLIALVAAFVFGTIALLGPAVADLYESVEWW